MSFLSQWTDSDMITTCHLILLGGSLLFMKSNYPQHEGIWSFGDKMDQGKFGRSFQRMYLHCLLIFHVF